MSKKVYFFFLKFTNCKLQFLKIKLIDHLIATHSIFVQENTGHLDYYDQLKFLKNELLFQCCLVQISHHNNLIQAQIMHVHCIVQQIYAKRALLPLYSDQHTYHQCINNQENIKFKINIQEKIERDDEKEDQVQLQISSNSITTSFHRLFKYSQFI